MTNPIAAAKKALKQAEKAYASHAESCMRRVCFACLNKRTNVDRLRQHYNQLCTEEDSHP